MSTAAIIGGSVAAAGIGAAGSMAAAGAQAGAAGNAAQLQYSLGEQQLAQNQAQFNKTQQNIAPWLQGGTQGVNTLASLLSTPGQGLLTPWSQTFTPPTAAQAAATPGYQFQLGAGLGAMQNSAAAGGGLLSTGTQESLNNYAQGVASTNYQNTYSNALNAYMTNFNTFQANQANTYNRLAGLAGLGQSAATNLGQQSNTASALAGQAAATTGQQVGGSTILGGTATASGYAGLANALSGGATNLSQYALLSNLLGSSGGGGLTATNPFSFSTGAPG